MAAFASTLCDVLRAPGPEADPGTERGRALTEAAGRLRLTRMEWTDRPVGPGVRERSLLATATAVRAAADRVVALSDLRAGVAPHPRTADLVAATADVLVALGTALRDPGQARPLDAAALDAALDAHAAARRAGSATALRTGLAAVALAEDVRFAALAVSGYTGTPGPAPDATPAPLWFLHAGRARLWWVRLRGHLTPRSVYLQNAVRLALGLGVARLVAGVFDLSHGFWVLLATLSLMRTSTLADRPVLLRALGGTLVGAVLAAVLLVVVGDDVRTYATLLPFVMVVAFTTGPLFGVAAAQGGFTVVVAVLFAQLAPSSWQLAEVRLLDVLVGGVVGLAIGAAVWPRGGGGEVRRAGAAALGAVADDVEALAAHLCGVPGAARSPTSSLQHCTLMLGHAYEQYRSEPLPPDPAPDWLAVVLVVRRADTYSTALRDRHPRPPAVVGAGDHALAACAADVVAGYRAAGRAVAEGRPPPPGGAATCRAGVTAASTDARDSRELDGWGWLHGLCDDLERVERALTPGPARVGAPQPAT